MTSQNGWRRMAGALAGGAVAGALIVGIGAPTALAAPGDDDHGDRRPGDADDDGRRKRWPSSSRTMTWAPAAASSPS